MADHDPASVMNTTYSGSNLIHYICKLGNAPILEVCVQEYVANLRERVLSCDQT